jgi:hypothetical protein
MGDSIKSENMTLAQSDPLKICIIISATPQASRIGPPGFIVSGTCPSTHVCTIIFVKYVEQVVRYKAVRNVSKLALQ